MAITPRIRAVFAIHRSIALSRSIRAATDLIVPSAAALLAGAVNSAQSKVSTVLATSPAFIARKAAFMTESRPFFVTIASRSSRPCL